MNLVQIQDRLRGMPIQLLQQYANGSNPEVPPYIALSVLKQKETEMQQHANAQGAAQGQMPSVKSQLEQKVGTMQQQASMMPQGLAQGPAAPAPQAPVQAASGGLMSGNAGSTMKFAEGGIIGYAGGGSTKRIHYAGEGENVLPETTGYEGMGLWDAIKAMGGDFQDYLAATEKASLQGPTTTRVVPTETPNTGNVAGSRRTPQQLAEAGVNPVVASPTARPPVAPGATPGGINQPAPTGGPSAPGGAGLGGSSVAAMLQKQLGKEIATPTAEGAAKSVQDINKQFGLDTPAGKEERELIAQMRAQREGQLKDRGFDNLVSFLTNARGSTLGETFASGARASQSEIEKQRADDMAHQQKMYDLAHGLNTADRAEKVGSAGKAATLFGDEQKSAATAESNRLTSLANIYHTDKAAAAQLEAARIAQYNRVDPQTAMRLKYLDQTQDSLVSELNKIGPYDKVKRAPKEAQLNAVRDEIAKVTGMSTIGAAPGASNTGGNAALYSKADAILNGKK